MIVIRYFQVFYPDSRLPTPDSRLPTPDSLLPKTEKSNSSNKSTRT
ncbi:hypothetical protein BJP36_42320 [Moorena producens JHB]|uniref:Uncharacterized protein n=1 Tax=Moorena producens (strain JHB) TaxID=1454205 RepID=A0A9Q9UVN7_MOOP1|nr:hypothetical protein [Moorena producens]WAN69001.1 hypothetical protein BJP36_42320 [Moorena producens JHB]